MKIISGSKLMPISDYTDKYVCTKVKMDRWMDARRNVRNFVFIVDACFEVRVCRYAEICKVFMYI